MFEAEIVNLFDESPVVFSGDDEEWFLSFLREAGYKTKALSGGSLLLETQPTASSQPKEKFFF